MVGFHTDDTSENHSIFFVLARHSPIHALHMVLLTNVDLVDLLLVT